MDWFWGSSNTQQSPSNTTSKSSQNSTFSNDCFAATVGQLTHNKTRVTSTGFLFQNAFGNIRVASTNKSIHCWQLKIKASDSCGTIYIGMVEASYKRMDTPFTWQGQGYGLASNGHLYSANGTKDEYYEIQQTGQWFGAKNMVTMRLDLNNKTLSFKINNNPYIVIKNIKSSEYIEYKMAVCLHSAGNCVQLMRYYNEGQNNNDIDENTEIKQQTDNTQNIMNKLQQQLQQKMNEIDKYKQEIRAQSKSAISSQDVLQEILTKRNNELNELTKANLRQREMMEGLENEAKKLNSRYNILEKEKQQLINDKNGLLQNIKDLQYKQQNKENTTNTMIKELENKIEILNKTIINNQRLYEKEKKQIIEQNQLILDEKQKEVKELKMDNGSLIEEQKELQIENERLKKENKELKLKLKTVDLSNYRSWDWKQILQWILSLENSRFKIYETKLRQALSEEEPDGEAFTIVEEKDVKRWGVKKFVDIKDLCGHIKQLTNQNNRNNLNVVAPNNELNEGNVSGGHYR